MILSKDKDIIYTYDDTYEIKSKEPYWINDSEGKPILIQPKNPVNHDSNSLIEQHPTFYYNLDQVVLHPTRIEPISNNPIALENEKKGKTIVYVKEDFVKTLNLPLIPSDYENEETIVVVFYGDDEPENDAQNYTRTYRTGVKRR